MRAALRSRCGWRVVSALLLGVLAGAPALAAQNLLDTYDQALRNDHDLLTAKAESGAAGARYRQARGQLLPQLSANARYNKVRQKQTFEAPNNGDTGAGGAGAGLFGRGNNGATVSDTNSYSLDLTQPLFNWTAWQNKDAAAARSDAARLSLSAAEQDLIVRVAQAYFDVLAAQDAAHSAREQQRQIERQLDRASAAFEAGLDPITDKQEARSSLDSARVDAINADNQLASAKEALIALTGRAPGQLAGVNVAAAVPPESGPARARTRSGWEKLALANSVQVASAQASWRAARENISAKRGGHFPTVDLVGSVGRQEQLFPVGAGGQANLVDETQSVGVQLQMPLFSGGSTTAAVSEAEYNAEQARLDLIDARRQLLVDINNAYRDVASGAQRVRAFDRAIASGQTALEAAKAGYKLGSRTILDVIDAQITLVTRRANRKQAWYDYVIAGLELREAAGVLDFNALGRINSRLGDNPKTVRAESTAFETRLAAPRTDSSAHRNSDWRQSLRFDEGPGN